MQLVTAVIVLKPRGGHEIDRRLPTSWLADRSGEARTCGVRQVAGATGLADPGDFHKPMNYLA